MTCTQRFLFVALLLVGCVLPREAVASQSSVENGYLYVPRLDVDGFGSLELVFRVVFDSEYRLLLESAEASVSDVTHSGVFYPANSRIVLDNVHVEGGAQYVVELEQLPVENELVFRIVEAREILGSSPAQAGTSADTTAARFSAAPEMGRAVQGLVARRPC